MILKIRVSEMNTSFDFTLNIIPSVVNVSISYSEKLTNFKVYTINICLKLLKFS